MTIYANFNAPTLTDDAADNAYLNIKAVKEYTGDLVHEGYEPTSFTKTIAEITRSRVETDGRGEMDLFGLARLDRIVDLAEQAGYTSEADALDGALTVEMRVEKVSMITSGGRLSVRDDAAVAMPGAGWVKGGRGDDLLLATEDGAKLHGGNGDDMLLGSDGEDSLFAGRGMDVLSGGAGEDRFSALKGVNFIDGGKGQDVAIFKGAAADFEIDVFQFDHDSDAATQDMSVARIANGKHITWTLGVEHFVFNERARSVTVEEDGSRTVDIDLLGRVQTSFDSLYAASEANDAVLDNNGFELMADLGLDVDAFLF